MEKILLDTNGYAALLAGDERLLDILARSRTVYMSIFVLGELFAGFKGGRREASNRKLLERFLSREGIKRAHATTETAEIFAGVKDGLRRAGTPIPINDVWIASHTIETGSTLVTFDEHFSRVPGLRIHNP